MKCKHCGATARQLWMVDCCAACFSGLRPSKLCKTQDQRKIFERIGDRIERERSDGIGAEGTYSEIVAAQQRGYIEGLRSGRLAAIRAIDPS